MTAAGPSDSPPRPSRPLSEVDALVTFGALAWEAVQAFADDPTFFAEMVEAANQIEAHRQDAPKRTHDRKLSHLRGRIADKIEVTADGCWHWTAALNGGGVPTMRPPGGGDTVPARRWTLAQAGLDVPRGRQVSAGCADTLCVHPDHARLGRTPSARKSA